ncbi:MAG: hypothetical protein H0X34_13655 [Chthoniobacterales bacterium]|jgi:hypothetical protein|nr:hypothetical protein [Chthoniobacterales bacterium]
MIRLFRRADIVITGEGKLTPPSHRTFVAELDGAVAGFIGYSPLDIYESGFLCVGSWLSLSPNASADAVVVATTPAG